MSTTKTSDTSQIRQGDNTPNVLIVDNDREAARLILEILARKGIRGHLAADEKTALDLLDKSDFDVVFTCERFATQPLPPSTRRADGETCLRAQKTNQKDEVESRSHGGFELLRKIKANSPELPVIIIADFHFPTGLPGSGAKSEKPKEPPLQQAARDVRYDDVLRRGTQTAVQAVRQGCYDFLTKPLRREDIETLLEILLPSHSVSIGASAQENSRCLYQIVGKSAKLVQTVNLAEKIAPTSAPALIIGESGTGKELFSYLIHHKSRRAQGPYVKVNCAALSDSLLESELFGHEKGAFTGAYTRRRGRFETAQGGTLLLDEITETAPRFQAKLLRVLEQQDFERVGGSENIRVDVRIISTTNKNIVQEVQEGRFRQDLYYRLGGIRLVIAPLRDRGEDLPELVWHFVNLYAREAGRRITKLDPVMMDIFAQYHWPGNVRQLRNVVRTALILGASETLSLADASWLLDGAISCDDFAGWEFSKSQRAAQVRGVNCPERIRREEPADELNCSNEHSGLGGVPLELIERRAILDTLRQTAGNQTKAAKALGISDRTLRDKIRRYREQGCLQPIR
ncbi:MAG TPA: sigma-54 dependent transcriptional regulator [Sedimentisphaerales bacterium]|nr:sigma-54 dependent transcriptional regulator [Sedimentisphaerales bacterium]